MTAKDDEGLVDRERFDKPSSCAEDGSALDSRCSNSRRRLIDEAINLDAEADIIIQGALAS
jgi:hypothetical protein